jgi:hypothetical protein
MTSAATTTPRGTGGRRAEGRGYGLVFFAAILLLIAGFFNMIYGIAAIANSHVFTANAHYVVGNLRAWAGSRLSSPSCSWPRRPGSWPATSWPAGSRWPWSGSAPST